MNFKRNMPNILTTVYDKIIKTPSKSHETIPLVLYKMTLLCMWNQHQCSFFCPLCPGCMINAKFHEAKFS
jgi:hypothetical protein